MSSFQPSVVLSALLDKHLGAAFAEFGEQLTRQLAERYGFDAAEAMAELGLDTIAVARSVAADAKPASKRRPVPAFPLPFCGAGPDEWCKALKLNHGLYTQCTMPHMPDGELCKTCQKAADGSGGQCTYGRVEDRVRDGADFKPPSGKAVVPYHKVMAKLKIDADAVAPEAAKFGWTIDPAVLEAPAPAPKKTKRPVVSPLVQSEEDEAPTEAPAPAKTKAGRPKAEKKKVVATSAGDDLIAQLVAEAEARSAAEGGRVPSEAQVEAQEARAQQQAASEAERTAQLVREEAAKADGKAQAAAKREAERAEKARLKEEEKRRKAAEREEAKAAKLREKEEAKAAKLREKEEAKAAKLREKEAAKAAKAAKPSAAAKAEAKKAEKAKAEAELAAQKQSAEEKFAQELDELGPEDEDEEGIAVSPLEWNGESYLRDAEDTLYSAETHEEVGRWDGERVVLIGQ